jgi:hypothetical protein
LRYSLAVPSESSSLRTNPFTGPTP